MISAVLNTLNEEKNLAHALTSLVGWVDEIIVVDMHSDDLTVDVAKSFGARIFYHDRVAAFDVARQFAVEKATGDWIILLDADEVIPPKYAEILKLLPSQGTADIYRLPRENYLLGAMLKHTGWGAEQDRLLRFWRRGSIEFSDRLHAFMTPKTGARIVDLPYEKGDAIVHFGYIGITQFVEKMNRYTNVEAAQMISRQQRRGYISLVKVTVFTFVERFIIKQGFRDGWRGLVLSLAMTFYHILIFAKVEEFHSSGTVADIASHYAHIAKDILATAVSGQDKIL